MPSEPMQFIWNILIIVGILIFLYGLACLWAVSTEDFNYYAVQFGKFLRRIYDKVAGIVNRLRKL